MLGDQIKKYRKEKKMSQEELAIPLNVVRQTVSKWENNLSVPDAELLIRLAEVLGISVAELLGTDEQPHSESLSAETLAIELARLNEELAKQVQERSLSSRAEQKRNLILFFFDAFYALCTDHRQYYCFRFTDLCLPSDSSHHSVPEYCSAHPHDNLRKKTRCRSNYNPF